MVKKMTSRNLAGFLKRYATEHTGKKMKVLTIVPALDVRSGWGRYSSSVLAEFRNREIEFRVATPSAGNPAAETVILRPFSLVNMLRNALSVRKAARDATIVHAFDGWPYAIYGYAAVWGTNKKLFINAIGTYALPGRSLVKKFLLNLSYSRAKRIFAISRYTRERVATVFGNEGKIDVVHLGVTPFPVLSLEEKSRLRKKFGIFSHPVFITVGAFKNRKGQKDTVLALALLKKEYPDFTYLLVGSGDDVAYIEEIRQVVREWRIESNIRILEDVESDWELAYLYSVSDVVVLNSRNDGGHFEGFGLVFPEAYQFGVPGVGSWESGIEDAIKDGETGFLSAQGDPQDIVEKLRKVLLDKERLGASAQDFARTFSWRKTTQAYIEAYSK